MYRLGLGSLHNAIERSHLREGFIMKRPSAAIVIASTALFFSVTGAAIRSRLRGRTGSPSRWYASWRSAQDPVCGNQGRSDALEGPEPMSQRHPWRRHSAPGAQGEGWSGSKPQRMEREVWTFEALAGFG